MFTLAILCLSVGSILALIFSVVNESGIESYSPIPRPFAAFILPWAIVGLIVSGSQIIIPEISHPSNIATPAKYTNQHYYIDSNANIYVDKNGSMQLVEKPKKQLIQYNELAKSASIEFKTTKTLTTNMSNWIPFYFESKTKTSISKVILPKSALTEKLTKVNVLNQAQSDSSDLTLSN